MSAAQRTPGKWDGVKALVFQGDGFPPAWAGPGEHVDLSLCPAKHCSRCYLCEADETFCVVRRAIYDACYSFERCQERWESLRSGGAVTDEALVQALRYEFGTATGKSATGGTWIAAQGSSRPSVTVRDSAGYRLVIAGKLLLRLVREELVLGGVMSKPLMHWRVERQQCPSCTRRTNTYNCGSLDGWDNWAQRCLRYVGPQNGDGYRMGKHGQLEMAL